MAHVMVCYILKLNTFQSLINFLLLCQKILSRFRLHSIHLGFTLRNEIIFLTASGDTGDLCSPNYPGNYPNNKLCTWTITGQPQKRIRVTFLDFDVQYGDSCEFDYVRAFSGSNQYGTRIFL